MSSDTPDKTRDHAIHEIDQLRLMLRQDLRFALQKHDGAACYIVEDPLVGAYYRIGLAEFSFLSQLNGRTTLAEALGHTANELGADAFTLEEATTICQWLLETGLATTADSRQARLLMERAHRLRQEAFRRRANPFFFRLPLVNPDAFLHAISPLGKLALSWPAFLLWIFTLSAAGLKLVQHWPELTTQNTFVYLQHHWLWITGAWLIIKLLHEIAHGVVCRHYGGHSPEGGLFFIFLAPIPYVDVTSAWRFASKWQRIATGGAGIYLELFLSAIAVLIWSMSTSDTVRTIALSVAFASGVTTLMFNMNILMRFDGYYMLVDLLEAPNLYSRGAQYIDYLFRRYALGVNARSPLVEVEFAGIIRLYAFAAFCWRWAVSFGMIAGAMLAFGDSGLLIAAAALLMWLILPAFRVAKEAFFGSVRQPGRPFRSLFILASVVGCATWCLSLTWPSRVAVASIVEYANPAMIRASSPGFAAQIHVVPGQSVSVGTLLVTLENPELKNQHDDLLLVRDSILLKRQRDFTSGQLAAYQARQNELAVIDQQLADLNRRLAALSVLSPIDGQIISFEVGALQGRYFEVGEEIITIGSAQSLELLVCVPPTDASAFNRSSGSPAEVWLWGGDTLTVELPRLDPRAVRTLPHPALASNVGGLMAVRMNPQQKEAESEPTELVVPCFTGRIPLAHSLTPQPFAGQRATLTFQHNTESVATVLWRKLDLSRFRLP